MKQESFTGFMTEVIKDLRQEGRFSTAHIYKYALRAVTEYVGGGEDVFICIISLQSSWCFPRKVRRLIRAYCLCLPIALRQRKNLPPNICLAGYPAM